MKGQDKKIDIVRNNVIKNVKIYSSQLAGHYYLYIFENQYFEMYYGTDNYLHLTGVGTRLSPSQFYNLAKSGQLQSNQLFFNKTTDENIFEIQYILSKTDIEAKYDTVLYAEDSDYNSLDDVIKAKIDDRLIG